MKIIIVLIILIFLLILGILSYLLNRQNLFISKLKAGDKISYGKYNGTVMSISNNNAIIKIEVPLVTLSKPK